MVSFVRKWPHAAAAFAFAQNRGGDVKGFDDAQTAGATAKALFDAFDVPHGFVFWLSCGRDAQGVLVCLGLHNSDEPGIVGVSNGPSCFLQSLGDCIAFPCEGFVSSYDCAQRMKKDEAPLVRDERVFCTFAGSKTVSLAVAVGPDTIQTEEGGAVVTIAAHCKRVSRIRDRDQAFDHLWSRGLITFKGYMGLCGTLGGLQRKINGQKNVKGVKTAPSPKLGPAAVIMPGAAQTTPHAPEMPLSGPVDAHNEALIVEYETFLVKNGLHSPEDARASAERSRQNVREGRGWREDKIENE